MTEMLEHLITSEGQEIPKIHVALLYEDFETGARATGKFEHLRQQFRGDLVFERSMWRFDILDGELSGQTAAQDAARADIVIFSAHGSEPLTHGVAAWIDLWLRQRSYQGGALVSLLDDDWSERENSPVNSYLRSVAQRAGFDYFLQQRPRISEAGGFNPDPRNQCDSRRDWRGSGWHRRYSRVQRWGLNE